MGAKILITVLFWGVLRNTNGTSDVTENMKDIFSMLEGKTRSCRLSINPLVRKPTATPLRKPGADLPITVDRPASSSTSQLRNGRVTEIWPKSVLSYKIHGHPSTLTMLETRRVFSRAFRLWSRHSPLNFDEVDDVRADINVRIESGHHGDGDVNAFDGPNGHLAHALPPPSGEVHFDADEFWSKRSFGRRHVIVTSESKKSLEMRSYYSLLMASVHEIGHVIGLRHTTNIQSVMYPLYARKIPNRKLRLHATDIKAIQGLYGPRNISSNPLHVSHSKFLASRQRKRSKAPPDPCRSSIDAAYSDRNTIHFFKDRYHWSWNSGIQEFSKPQKYKIRLDLSKPRVDAACYSNFSGRTYIFSGKKFWRYHADVLETGYPRLSSNHGLPSRPTASFQIPDTEDIVLIKRKKIYIFDEISETAKLVVNLHPLLGGREHHSITAKLFSIYNNSPLDSAVEFNSTLYFLTQRNVFSSSTNPIEQLFSNSEIPTISFSLSRHSEIPWLKHCDFQKSIDQTAL